MPRAPSSFFRIFGFLVLAAAITGCQMQTTPAANPPTAPAATTADSPTDVPAATAVPPPQTLPSSRLDAGGDVNSSKDATNKTVPGGDVFIHDLYERPFNANTMDTYFPYLDIVGVQAFKDDTWGYATITMAGKDSNGALSGQYAVELDLNRDGRGDWLIKASTVSSSQWTTAGVQAFQDANHDVGGTAPLTADPHVSKGDGYETLVFDQGKSGPADSAWVRIDPNDPTTVDLAFKLSMLGNPSAYTLGAWAGTDLNPSLFDYNDHMTHAQAGSPNWGDTIYPLKDMAQIDNTCRLAIGFVGTAADSALCSVLVRTAPEKPGAPPVIPPPPPPPP